MKRLFMVLALTAALMMPLAAHANLVMDPGFDSPLTTGVLTVPGNDGLWLIAPQSSWSISNAAAVSTGGVDWLIQGCTLPSTCFGPGWKVNLSFDYQTSGTSQVQVTGFAAAQTWDPATGAGAGTPLTAIPLSAATSMTTYNASFFLPQGSQTFSALGVGFNLAAGTNVSMAVDNVDLELVAPVSFRISPVTLNLKSKGSFVTAFISKPPSCFKLANINQGTVQLTFGGSSIPPQWINAKGNKFMMKFDRAALVEMLTGQSGQVTLTVTGAFNDGTAFAGDARIRVINPGKPKGKK